jgi:hypothetical protein
MLEFVGIVILILIIVLDPYANFKQIYYVAIAIVLVFLLKSKMTSYGVLFAILVLFSLVIHFSSRSEIYQDWMTPVSTGLMLLLVLSAMVPRIRKWADSQTGATGGIIIALLFIPCLLYDFGQYLATEIRTTPWIVWKIGIGLLFVSFLFFRGPALLRSILSWFGPTYIQKEIVRFGTASEPKQHTIEPTADLPYTNFSISFWLYNNESRVGNKAHTVLNYGGRPHIQVRQNQLFISNDSTDPQLAGTIPLQKWVHIVLTYERNVCNVFVNGEFIKTLSIPAIPFNRTQTILIGDDEVFGDGGIQMLRQINHAMSKMEILTDMYKGHKGRAVL